MLIYQHNPRQRNDTLYPLMPPYDVQIYVKALHCNLIGELQATLYVNLLLYVSNLI